MPPAAMTLVQERVTSLVTTQRPSLLGLGVLVALWAASCGVDSARKALNLAYDVKESRPFWRTQLVAIAATLISSLFILLVVGVLIAGGFAGHWVAARLGIERAFSIGLGIVRWPLTAALMMLGSAVGFHLLPDVKQKFTFMLPGAIVGTLLWLGATWVFTQYVRYFGSYDVTYGSIAGVVVLLTWLYISGFIFVIGGEINAILEHAAVVGKEDGARDESEAAPPPSQRPSFAAARRGEDRGRRRTRGVLQLNATRAGFAPSECRLWSVGPRDDTLHVRRTRSLATIPLALIAVGGCRTGASAASARLHPKRARRQSPDASPCPTAPTSSSCSPTTRATPTSACSARRGSPRPTSTAWPPKASGSPTSTSARPPVRRPGPR